MRRCRLRVINKQRRNNMKRTNVESSNIISIGYDETNCILEIEFKKNSIYQYFDISKEIHEGLMKATSHGKFLNENIKKKNYRYIKIN